MIITEAAAAHLPVHVDQACRHGVPTERMVYVANGLWVRRESSNSVVAVGVS